jgi:3-oxoacyl-[acyl-carrier protein] reductase
MGSRYGTHTSAASRSASARSTRSDASSQGELGRYGIRVVTIQSVGIPESHALDGEGDGTPPRLLERAPTLADVGNVALFAASDHAAAITATAINMTCGAEVD